MNFYTQKNILVTGGTGFVGSHLVEELIKQGSHVYTTFLSSQPYSYFNQQGLNRKATMIQADVTDFKRIFGIVTKYNIDIIFHLAAQAFVEVGYYNPLQTLNTNIAGTINILEAARLFPKVKAVVIASSDKAYGKLKKKKYDEQDALSGDHPYEVSKSAADLIARAYFRTYRIPVVITRFGNIYGEGDMNFSRIVPGIMKSTIRTETLEVRSNGKYVRDYVYVKDVVEGFISLAEQIEKVQGEAFNFGSEDTYSVIELIGKIKKSIKKKIKYNILDTAKNEIPYQSLDYSRIRKRIGWRPRRTIASQIKKIYSWYKKNA